MSFVFKAVLLFSLILLVSSATVKPRFVVHEIRDTFPDWHYQKLETRSHEEATIPIRIGIAQRNLHRGYEFLMDVSHPSSNNFGKHWTEQQVHDMFSPSPESVKLVKQWLVSSGIDASRIQHAGGDFYSSTPLVNFCYKAKTTLSGEMVAFQCDCSRRRISVEYKIPCL